MVISDENCTPIYIDNIDTPTITDYFWVLELGMLDFTLNELKMFEELTTPALALLINDYFIEVPANWNILIFSEETGQLDVAEMSDLTKGEFTSLVYLHQKDKIVPGPVKVVDYFRQAQILTPALNKHTMLCHHIGPDGWVCIAPTDNYNRYLKDASLGNLLS